MKTLANSLIAMIGIGLILVSLIDATGEINATIVKNIRKILGSALLPISVALLFSKGE